MTPLLEPAASGLLAGVFEAALRATALGAVVALVLAGLRITAAPHRLGAWTVVLVTALLIPTLGLATPRLSLTIPLGVLTDPLASVQVGADRGRPTTVDNGPASQLPVKVELETTAPVAGAPDVAPASGRDTGLWIVGVAAVYLLVVAMLVVRVAAGMLAARRLIRSASPVTDANAIARLRVRAGDARLRGAPPLVETARVSVPMTLGVLRPILVLNPGWRDWEEEVLDAVFVHELAHVGRRDALLQRLALIGRAVYWFNPLSWWLHRHIVALCEQASDEAVLHAGADRVSYARMLVEFCRLVPEGSRRADWHVAMARGGSAEWRVDRILDGPVQGSGRLTLAASLGIALAVGPAALGASGIDPAIGSREDVWLPPHVATSPGLPAPRDAGSALAMDARVLVIQRPDLGGIWQVVAPDNYPELMNVGLVDGAPLLEVTFTDAGDRVTLEQRGEGVEARAAINGFPLPRAVYRLDGSASTNGPNQIVSHAAWQQGRLVIATTVGQRRYMVTFALDGELLLRTSNWEDASSYRSGSNQVAYRRLTEFRERGGAPSQTARDADSEFLMGASLEAADGVVSPRVRQAITPRYTSDAMRQKIQGIVKVQVVVMPDGTVDRARVVESLDTVYGLDENAREAAMMWTFEPDSGTLNGQPVPVAVELKLEFRLHFPIASVQYTTGPMRVALDGAATLNSDGGSTSTSALPIGRE